MCTLVILRRPEHRWPVLIGANRDEMIDRPWQPPGRHWPDRPEVVAGLDNLAGGAGVGGNRLGGRGPLASRSNSLSHLQPDNRRRARCFLAAPYRERPGRVASAQGGAVDDCGGRTRRTRPAAAGTSGARLFRLG